MQAVESWEPQHVGSVSACVMVSARRPSGLFRLQVDHVRDDSLEVLDEGGEVLPILLRQGHVLFHLYSLKWLQT